MRAERIRNVVERVLVEIWVKVGRERRRIVWVVQRPRTTIGVLLKTLVEIEAISFSTTVSLSHHTKACQPFTLSR